MAIDLDGTDDYVSAGSGATLDDIWDGGGTVSFWFNMDALPGDAGSYGLVSQRNVGATTGWHIQLSDVSGAGSRDNVLNLRCSFSTTAGIWESADEFFTTGYATVWTHIAITYNADADTNDPVFYVNGTSISVTEFQTPSGTRSSGAADDLRIGMRLGGFGGFLDGRMDDVRLFTRLLTAEEVAILAAGYRGPLGGEGGWWSCDNFRGIAHPDGTTLTAATHYLRDESGNGNTGDPIGGVVARASEAPYAFPWWPNGAGQGPMGKDPQGAISFVGTVTKATAITSGFSGALGFAGALVRQANKVVAGAITFAGALVRQANKVVAGAITFVGTLSTIQVGIARFFANVRSLLTGADQDSTLSAPEHTRIHKG